MLICPISFLFIMYARLRPLGWMQLQSLLHVDSIFHVFIYHVFVHHRESLFFLFSSTINSMTQFDSLQPLVKRRTYPEDNIQKPS